MIQVAAVSDTRFLAHGSEIELQILTQTVMERDVSAQVKTLFRGTPKMHLSISAKRSKIYDLVDAWISVNEFRSLISGKDERQTNMFEPAQ